MSKPLLIHDPMNDIATTEIKISDISFGRPAAERDIDGLEKYFVDTESFKRVERGEKSVLIGNRGTGKSAILKVLAQRERSNGTVFIELAPEDYSYEMLSDSIAKESSGNWAKHGA
jgi:predicted AAA+ superfamily ATPase